LNSDYLRIGAVVRAHGVRGAIKVVPTTDDPRRFLDLAEVFVEQGGSYRPVAVLQAQLLNDGVSLQLAGIDTRDEAEKLRGAYLCVDRAHAVTLAPDSYFVADLVGCEALDTAGRRLGRVTDVLSLPANDVYEIDGGRLLVPALKRVLATVDLAGKRIVFDADALAEVAVYAD